MCDRKGNAQGRKHRQSYRCAKSESANKKAHLYCDRKKPDISILSDEFLAEVSHLPQKNLAVEMLRKLLTNEIKTRSRRNVVKSRLFSELLEGSIRKYQNRAIQAA